MPCKHGNVGRASIQFRNGLIGGALRWGLDLDPEKGPPLPAA